MESFVPSFKVENSVVVKFRSSEQSARRRGNRTCPRQLAAHTEAGRFFPAPTVVTHLLIKVRNEALAQKDVKNEG
jgi:hypothetical protein